MRIENRARLSRFTVSIVAALFVLLAGSPALLGQVPGRAHLVSEPTDVGMVALTAFPDKYDGKMIRTHGFLCVEFEGDALYLHEEDYRHGLTKNSVALRLSKKQRAEFKAMNLAYVLVEGTVFAHGLERTDRWSGAIGRITRLEVWPIDRGPVPHK